LGQPIGGHSLTVRPTSERQHTNPLQVGHTRLGTIFRGYTGLCRSARAIDASLRLHPKSTGVDETQSTPANRVPGGAHMQVKKRTWKSWLCLIDRTHLWSNSVALQPQSFSSESWEARSAQMLATGGISLFLPLIRQDARLDFAQGGTLAAASTLVYALL
jgi:hypothetical protein